MPTFEELHAADQGHAMAIAELRARIGNHDDILERHERHLAKLDETVVMLREGLMTVARKDDISDLRRDINEKFDKRLTDAHNSIPAKFAAVCAAGMFLLAAVTLALNIVRHG
jgi:hypothetical protein